MRKTERDRKRTLERGHSEVDMEIERETHAQKMTERERHREA